MQLTGPAHHDTPLSVTQHLTLYVLFESHESRLASESRRLEVIDEKPLGCRRHRPYIS